MIPKVSIVIPSYNESECICELVERIASSTAEWLKTDGGLEVVIVDDNSPDGTISLCQVIAIKHPFLRVIVRHRERGLATAIRKGIEESYGDIIVVMDADLSHSPEMVPTLVTQVAQDSIDIAVASRFINGGDMISSRRCVWGSKFLNRYVTTLLHIPAKDVTGGFFAIRRSALDTINFNTVFKGHGDYCFALLYEGLGSGWHMSEFGFTYHARKHGTSKTNYFRSGISYGVRAIKLRLGID